jgi:hypothetical protein
VRVFQNVVAKNDTPNFAPKGNIVATVPMGTGVLIMANDNVQLFENVFDENATSNVMIVSYRQSYTDARYDPRPRRISLARNQHGRAGYAPQLPGGEQLAQAFGGSIPPVLWDGTGDPASLRVDDGVAVLGMGLAQGAALETANPAPVELKGTAAAPLPAVVLPESMEAALK